MTLADIVASHRVVVCVGSGGVGKTTTAAALALHAAMRGRRVLCLTIDPARRLANSLGLTEMREQEQSVPRELFEAQNLVVEGSLAAMMLDTKRTFDELVRTTASSPERAQRILGNRLYQYISTSLAGTQEYMAMEKLHAVRRDRRYDLVVLDTPPTSNALDFLDAPARLSGLVDSPAMRWLTQTVEGGGSGGARGFSLSLLTKGAKVVLAGMSKFTGAGFIEQVAHFVTDFNDLFGGFRKRAEEVANALRSEEVAFVIVTSPAPLSVDEAIFFSERLEESGMGRDAFVVNQVHPLVAEPSETTSVLEGEAKRALPEGADGPRLVSRMRRALDDARLQAVADRLECDRHESRGGKDALYVEVPVLDQDVHDLASLAEIASYLVGDKKHAAVTR